mgnify:CR=1 FL=1
MEKMKVPNKGNRPIPVLLEDGGDYTNGSHFKTNVEMVSTPRTNEEPIYKFAVFVDILCPPLKRMISQNQAKVVVCLEQDTTRKFLDYEEGMVIEVNASTLRLTTNLDITPIVVTTGKTELTYDPEFMDPIYRHFSNQEFALEKAQILGYGRVAHIKTNAVKGLSQIITICKLKEKDLTHPYTIDLKGDKIIINANPEITDNIKLIQTNSMQLEGLVNSSFAYAVFFYVIEMMIVDHDTLSSWRWFSAIVSKINKVRSQKGLSEFDPDSFLSQCNSPATRPDEVWTLVSQLLTDDNGQMMLLGFESAGKFAENQ